jgi:uncharacterized DUF497 family protein
VFEWDSRKAADNFRKHGVQFADAVSVLEDDRAITVSDDSGNEERWVSIGMDAVGRILVAVYAGGVRVSGSSQPVELHRANAVSIRRIYEERI